MKGRKPTPTKLHLLHGQDRKVKDRKGEPQPETSIPDMPGFLSDDAAEEWHYIAPRLENLGLVSDIDKAALAAYCQAFGRWSKMEAILNKGGVVYKKKKLDEKTGEMVDTGELVVNPLLWVANRAMEQMRQFLTEFGMTPSSRSRIVVEKQKKLTNEYEKWKNRTKKG